jgi:hypothetical protein
MADNEYYVYRLIDPRNKNTFYVGKGKGDRVFAHVQDALKNYKGINYSEEIEDEISTKISLIREIHARGMEVEIIYHRRGLDEKTAYEVEAALIDAYPGLTNSVKGHGNTDRGPMPVNFDKSKSSIIDKVHEQSANNGTEKPLNSNKITEFKEKCVIIKVHQETVDKYGLYEAVRQSWRARKEKAERADYVIAVVNKIVRGVFKPEYWYRTTEANARKHNDRGFNNNRIAFIGVEADDNIKKAYLNKQIPDEYIPSQNPIQYNFV